MEQNNGPTPSEGLDIDSIISHPRTVSYAVQAKAVLEPDSGSQLGTTVFPKVIREVTVVAPASAAEDSPPEEPTADQMYKALEEQVKGPEGAVDLTMGEDGVVQVCIRDKCFVMGEGPEAFNVAQELFKEIVSPELLRVVGLSDEAKDA